MGGRGFAVGAVGEGGSGSKEGILVGMRHLEKTESRFKEE